MLNAGTKGTIKIWRGEADDGNTRAASESASVTFHGHPEARNTCHGHRRHPTSPPCLINDFHGSSGPHSPYLQTACSGPRRKCARPHAVPSWRWGCHGAHRSPLGSGKAARWLRSLSPTGSPSSLPGSLGCIPSSHRRPGTRETPGLDSVCPGGVGVGGGQRKG